MRTLGITLVVIGLITLLLPYIPFTKQEKVLDLGVIQATTTKEERVPISPIVGAVILLAGAGITIAALSAKKA